MSINAKLIADSINVMDSRLTSWELEYPLSIHAELMTHRAFSRNAASARAIPYHTMRDSIEENPALPIRWGTHQKGMQSGSDMSENHRNAAIASSKDAMFGCIQVADYIHDDLEGHKSIVNRLLTPWAHIKVIVTSTSPGLHNFFALRAHPDAEPNFQVLAYKMLKLYTEHIPLKVEQGDWHIPYADMVHPSRTQQEKIKIAVARCCWVSYNKPGKPIDELNMDDAFERHDSAAAAGHMSPFEHCALATFDYTQRQMSNFDTPIFSGWKQYRKFFPNELKTPNLRQIMSDVPDWIQPHLL